MIKNNVHETNNFTELKRLLRQYEEKISHLEAEKIRERNQSEELLDMVRRLMGQKRELLDKLTQLEEGELSKLQYNGKSVIAETLDLHNQMDSILKRTSSHGSVNSSHPRVPQAAETTEFCTEKENVEVFRFQNIKLINRVLCLSAVLKKRQFKVVKSESLLEGLLKDPSSLFTLSDKVLNKLRIKLTQSVSGIDEQLISRKLTKRLLDSLQSQQVTIEQKTEEFELLKEFSVNSVDENCDSCLGKRITATTGAIKQDSIDAILRAARLPCGQQYDDTSLPPAIKNSLELIDCEDDVQEIDLLDSSNYFSAKKRDTGLLCVSDMQGHLDARAKNSSRHRVGKKLKAPGMIDLSQQKNQLKSLQIDLTDELEAEIVDEIDIHKLASKSSSESKHSDAQVSQNASSAIPSQESSKACFKINREPLAEITNQDESAANAEFASPQSSLYYFTSKKNEHDFSFDRTTFQVEKNLGEALMMDTIQKSRQKENLLRPQR